MSTRLIAGTIMGAVLLVVVLLALRGCESPSTEPNEPIQYPNQEETTVTPSEPTTSSYEKTTSSAQVQYPNEGEITVLPDTGPSVR